MWALLIAHTMHLYSPHQDASRPSHMPVRVCYTCAQCRLSRGERSQCQSWPRQAQQQQQQWLRIFFTPDLDGRTILRNLWSLVMLHHSAILMHLLDSRWMCGSTMFNPLPEIKSSRKLEWLGCVICVGLICPKLPWFIATPKKIEKRFQDGIDEILWDFRHIPYMSIIFHIFHQVFNFSVSFGRVLYHAIPKLIPKTWIFYHAAVLPGGQQARARTAAGQLWWRPWCWRRRQLDML